MTGKASRIAIPDLDAMRADVAGLLPLIAPPGREPARTMAVLTNQPDLFQPFLGWAAALALHGALSHREHELLALRAAWNCQSAFEWGEHVDRAAGVTEAEIIALGTPEVNNDGHWSAFEAALISAADELHSRTDVSDATWAVLAADYPPAALVEIPLVVGQYTMLSMLANAARIDAVDGAALLPPGRA